MQITVVGAGYVGLSLATLLGQKHEVIVLDIDEEKVAKVNSRISPVQDVYLEKFFAERKLNLTATVDTAIAYKDAEYAPVIKEMKARLLELRKEANDEDRNSEVMQEIIKKNF